MRTPIVQLTCSDWDRFGLYSVFDFLSEIIAGLVRRFHHNKNNIVASLITTPTELERISVLNDTDFVFVFLDPPPDAVT